MIIILIKKGVKAMKQAYKKPAFDVKGFAQFENVFTVCNKETATKRSSSGKGTCRQDFKVPKKNPPPLSNFGDTPGS